MICWFVEIVNTFFGLSAVWKFHLINKSSFDHPSNAVHILERRSGVFQAKGKKKQQQQKQQQPVVAANVNVSSFPPLTYQLKRILYLKATYVLKHPLAFKLDSHSNLNHFGKHNPPHILCALRKTYAVAGPGSILTFHFLVFIILLYCYSSLWNSRRCSEVRYQRRSSRRI